jgi:tetratricopeptide (TPR) repeat protein
MGPGRVSVPLAQVERIESGQSALAEYQARAAAIGPGDAGSWAQLGEWARGAGLLTQSRDAFDRALALDPSNAIAHQGLGHVLLPGGWLSRDDANRARGLVEFEGRWMSPEDRQAALQERAEDRREDAERRAAEARVREAEARAEAAEAEARRVRVEADTATDGIPYGWVGSGCGFNCGGYGGRPPRPHRPPAHRPPPTTPPATPPPHDTGSSHPR